MSERGEVVVVLPRRAPTATAERLVEEHRAWIERHVVRLREEHARLASRPALGEGRPLMLEGAALPVWLADKRLAHDRVRVTLVHDRLLVRPRDGQSVRVTLETWLRERARTRLGERIGARAAELGVRAGRLSVRDQRSRWASASARGDLSFSWRLIMAPPFVLDAVVVHELAHLRVRGHSSTFWSLVEGHAPRTSEARGWLREHARELRAALD